MVKGVIFDLDGTIVDSLDTLWRAFNDGVTAFKLEPVGQERLFGLMNQGIGLADILGEIYPELRSESSSKTVVGIMSEIKKDYLAQCLEEVGLSGGVPELFSRLRARGLKIGVVTSRTVTPEKMWREFGRLGVTQFIDAVVTATESRRKPAPEPVIECLKRLELLPGECIFVGDSQADMRAGKASGVGTVAIATGVSAREDLEAESPDFVFSNLHSFMAKLDFILNGG